MRVLDLEAGKTLTLALLLALDPVPPEHANPGGRCPEPTTPVGQGLCCPADFGLAEAAAEGPLCVPLVPMQGPQTATSTGVLGALRESSDLDAIREAAS